MFRVATKSLNRLFLNGTTPDERANKTLIGVSGL
jgi:hypothetical protein